MYINIGILTYALYTKLLKEFQNNFVGLNAQTIYYYLNVLFIYLEIVFNIYQIKVK